MDTPAIHCHFLPIKMAVSILESMIWKKPALIMKSKQVLIFGRNERIRTSDPFVPNEVRYRAALHSEWAGIIEEFSEGCTDFVGEVARIRINIWIINILSIYLSAWVWKGGKYLLFFTFSLLESRDFIFMLVSAMASNINTDWSESLRLRD